MSAQIRRDPVPMPSLGPRDVPVWLVAAHVTTCSADERARFAELAAPAPGSGRLLFVTCHRAELYGTGAPPDEAELAALAGPVPLAARLRVVTGEAAARHVFRLAAGLESAVIGEDQILHQIRELRELGRRRGDVDPHLARLLEVAAGVGRRARAGRDRGPADEPHTLAGRAIDWLAAELDPGCPPAEIRLLVAGAGTMGRLLASEARRRGYALSVASREAAHAQTLAADLGATSLTLAEAAEHAADGGFDAIAVALRGPWPAIAASAMATTPIVDLSSPPAVPPAARGRRLDIDALFDWAAAPAREDAAHDSDEAYVRLAEALVDEALTHYERWSTGRASVETLRTLRDRAEARRSEELARLLRRLPDLEPRERGLVEAFSEQLVASILHQPSARLREDADGSVAAAARRLFDL